MLGSLLQDQANAILNYALDKGINFIVTSAAYRVVETMITEAVGHRRDEFYLATTTDHRSAKWAKADIENSLKIFKTDFIDVYQIGEITLQRALDLALDPRGAVERAVLCDGCGECERTCPYKLSIIPIIKRAVQSIDWLPAYRPLLKKTDYEHEQ